MPHGIADWALLAVCIFGVYCVFDAARIARSQDFRQDMRNLRLRRAARRRVRKYYERMRKEKAHGKNVSPETNLRKG